MFRDLKANEIEARVNTVRANGCSLLLYKDARCDMNILDETVGAFNWRRKHEVINGNLFCTVEIYDKEHNEWIPKQDVGVESYTEKEKGQASDAFKRACFNWGIGRELYTSPFIWIPSSKCEMKDNNGKKSCYDKFKVHSIEIKDKKIVKLSIINEKINQVVFEYDENSSNEAKKDIDKSNEVSKQKIDKTKVKIVQDVYKKNKEECLKFFSTTSIGAIEDMTEGQFTDFIKQCGE